MLRGPRRLASKAQATSKTTQQLHLEAPCMNATLVSARFQLKRSHLGIRTPELPSSAQLPLTRTLYLYQSQTCPTPALNLLCINWPIPAAPASKRRKPCIRSLGTPARSGGSAGARQGDGLSVHAQMEVPQSGLQKSFDRMRLFCLQSGLKLPMDL